MKAGMASEKEAVMEANAGEHTGGHVAVYDVVVVRSGLGGGAVFSQY